MTPWLATSDGRPGSWVVYGRLVEGSLVGEIRAVDLDPDEAQVLADRLAAFGYAVALAPAGGIDPAVMLAGVEGGAILEG